MTQIPISTVSILKVKQKRKLKTPLKVKMHNHCEPNKNSHSNKLHNLTNVVKLVYVSLLYVIWLKNHFASVNVTKTGTVWKSLYLKLALDLEDVACLIYNEV